MSETRKKANVEIEDLENVVITVGGVEHEEEEWEPLGPTPMPSIKDLRDWDIGLLKVLSAHMCQSVDGQWQYDSVFFPGHTYYHASQMLAALKNFASWLKAVNIDQHYQPNAYLSFKDMNKKEFIESLNELIDNINR